MTKNNFTFIKYAMGIAASQRSIVLKSRVDKSNHKNDPKRK